MRHRDLARLLIKIGGLFILVTALGNLPIALGTILWGGGQDRHGIFALINMSLAPVAISLVAGLWMFVFSGRIVDRYIIVGDQLENQTDPELSRLEALFVSILGLYLFASGVGPAISGAARVIGFHAHPIGDDSGAYWLSWFASEALRPALGLILVFRSKQIAQFLHQSRGS